MLADFREQLGAPLPEYLLKSAQGCCIALRAVFGVIRELPEAERASVYVLLGQEDMNDLPMAYIGEADPLIERLVQHYGTKDW